MSAIAKVRTERLRRPAVHSPALAVRARRAPVLKLGLLEVGYIKVSNWQSTMYLFENESRCRCCPRTSPVAGSFGELFFPTLRVLGLANRLGAIGLHGYMYRQVLRRRATRRRWRSVLWGTWDFDIVWAGKMVAGSPLEQAALLTLGRQTCGDWDTAIGREWLVTNGLGGYACGTVAGANTRRYHAFLMASLDPPVERTLLVAKIDLCVDYLGERYQLSANEFAGGAVDPKGFIHIESFAVREGIPTWRYAVADALIEQRIFMAPLAHVSYLHLTLERASGPLLIEFKPLVTYRDFHSQARGAQAFEVEDDGESVCVRAAGGARPCRLKRHRR